MRDKPQILLTNDDGIDSPGLWAAARALSTVGYVHVIAPSEQQSGAGRSLPAYSDGIIHARQIQVKDQPWTVFAIEGTPAQAVQHGILEIMDTRPDLVVAGINYGSNVGTGVTISGTVGAALEAAAHGIPAMAVSLETADRYHLTYSTEIDFSVAAHFTALFAACLVGQTLLPDVDVVKIEVPDSATKETPWQVTRLSRQRYYESIPPKRSSLKVPGPIRYRQSPAPEKFPQDSDVYALRVQQVVSVTPLSLDLTSRIALQDLDHVLCQNIPGADQAARSP